jgi:formylglycine-generating enzyme required for sulfatase activity
MKSILSSSSLSLLFFLISIPAANAAGSLLRVTCEGADIGAEVSINGTFKGECPVDIQILEGQYKLRVEMKIDAMHERVFEQDIRMGDGIVKKIEAVLTTGLNAEGRRIEEQRIAAERVVATRRESEARAAAEAEAQRQAEETAKREAAEREAATQALAELAQHMVHIPGKNYELGKYEVTQDEWRGVMDNNPSYFTNCGGNCPVEQVSWNDIQKFLQKLNAKTGKQYRLPTEAEWQYACFGGQGGLFSEPEYCGGNDLNTVGWYSENSGNATHPVGQKQANGYGLYDMSGNVWEWMENCYDNSCGERALRGGSWFSNPNFARAAFRNNKTPARQLHNYGFRVARTLP